jgi:hypothetical protein
MGMGRRRTRGREDPREKLMTENSDSEADKS